MARLVEPSALDALDGRRIGLEKESLRVDAGGTIARTPHPESLGAALTHPSVTTDFSEALVEMVTPPEGGPREALATLEGIHRWVAARLEHDEYLWNASMPCILDGEDSIRIARYGASHAGRMKRVYRRGLATRYGRRMQAIAGIHFNVSLPESAWSLRAELLGDAREAGPADPTRGYFATMCNLVNVGWMVPWLFGASPAICRTFLAPGATTDLDTLAGSTLYAPDGTSLRMGNIGYRYREDVPIDLSVDHSGFGPWVRDVVGHVTTEHPPYAALGLRDAKGRRLQLNANRLQIENEYYGTVRPKQVPRAGEMPILALRRRGIRYLELRSVDIDPFEPAGIGLDQVAALELLVLHAWLADPAPLGQADIDRTKRNLKAVAHAGRDPALRLEDADGSRFDPRVRLRAVLGGLGPLADALDARAQDGGRGGRVGRAPAEPLYGPALAAQLDKLEAPETLPSARTLAGVVDAGSFAEFTAHASLRIHEELVETPPPAALEASLDAERLESFARRERLEAASDEPFEPWLARWFAQLDGVRGAGSAKDAPMGGDAVIGADVGAVVLAGGLARRMGGVDKALVPFLGRPMVAHVVERIRPHVAALVVNTNRDVGAYAGLGVRTVADAHADHPGPLAGLAAGLAALGTPYVFMCPCDSPFASGELVERLAAGIAGHDVAVAHDGTRLQPVFALVRASVGASLDAFLAGGGRKIDAWYATLDAVEVRVPELAAAFANFNTAAELEAAELEAVGPDAAGRTAGAAPA